ncbi:MAG: P-loop NTPase [Thaumarchaeota archaeon]|nr:P-loop NTPase [Nitrososphaerota archaeon]
MKQITILSGKGGTGKTTITAAFAVLAKKAVVADCDVDAPDLHMLLHPEVLETKEFRGSKIAVIDEMECVKCDICREKCRFDAITQDLTVNPFSCEGCGVCTIVCPVKAVSLTERISGYAYISKIKYGFMVHALLNPGESNSGKLATVVRQNAKLLAEKEGSSLIIIDGPPGIGCPVIASVTGVDAALVVTEPTMSGIHDLERALQLLRYFNVRPFACVNMYDVNMDNASKISTFCEENGVEVVGNIPFNPVVTEAMVNGKAIVEYSPECDVAKEIAAIWDRLGAELLF